MWWRHDVKQDTFFTTGKNKLNADRKTTYELTFILHRIYVTSQKPISYNFEQVKRIIAAKSNTSSNINPYITILQESEKKFIKNLCFQQIKMYAAFCLFFCFCIWVKRKGDLE